MSILDPRYSLRARIALIVAILTLITTIILTFITGQISGQQLENNIGGSLAQLSSILTSQIDQTMFERWREIRLTASQTALFSTPNHADEARLALNQLAETNRDYAWIGWADASGKVIAGVDGLLEGTNVAALPWFQQANGATAPYVGKIQEVPGLADRIPGRADIGPGRYIDLSMPIRGSTGQLIGVLGAYIDTRFLRDQALAVEHQFDTQRGFSTSGLPESGSLNVFILASDGTVLIGPGSYPSPHLSDAPKLTLQTVQAARAGQSGYLTETWSDTFVPYLTGYARDAGFRGYSGLGWIVLTRQRADVALASVAQLQWLLLALGILFAALSSAVGWILALQITHPLVQVAERARNIKTGDWREGNKAPVLSNRADEVSVLSHTLDRLLVSLDNRNTQLTDLNNDLERLVQQRTGELTRSQRFNEKIVGTVPDVVYTYDCGTGKSQYINPAVKSLLGYSSAEWSETVNHRTLQGLIHEEDQAAYVARQQAIEQADDGVLIDGSYRLKHRDGHWLWIDDRQTIFSRDTEGKPIQVFGVMQDATFRKQAEAKMRETAASDERQRLARELHDSVTQTLFSASMVAQSLPLLWEKGETIVKKNLEELSRLNRGALAEMRTLLNELRPAAIATANLEELINHLLDAARGRTPAEFSLIYEGDQKPPPEVQVAVYRVAQEALNNITKHARARHVQLKLIARPDHLEMQIADDGRGFNPEMPASDHFGLGIMRERAQEIGATLQVESQPGHGTTVTLVWQPSSELQNAHEEQHVGQ